MSPSYAFARAGRGYRARVSELSEAWVDGDETARWRSAAVHGPGTGARASGSSLLEVDPSHRLPVHTDSAEEVIVVVRGRAEVTVDGTATEVGEGGIALVPECAPHSVRNIGEDVLRFVAVYADTDVTTTYEADVQPDGGRERTPVS
jgi:mannose-6-phosphate isomerase-like protein (cupin superfamily)